MKNSLIFLGCLAFMQIAYGQKKPLAQKAVDAAEKAKQKTQQYSEASNRISEQAGQTAANAGNIVRNVKNIVKVFQPIFQIHFKKKNRNAVAGAQNEGGEPVVIKNATTRSDNSGSGDGGTPPDAGTETPQTTTSEPSPNFPPASAGGGYTAPPQQYGTPESDEYNSDGTANWGNQYNPEHGCYLDAFTGTILDGGSAEDKPNAVDLIFLAPNDGQNAYYLITPNFAHDNASADAFWGSATTDNPVKTWKEVNETEVALTSLTGAQFEKIQYNENLRGAVKQAKGFASFYSSLTKLDGKVFAVKSTMANRDAYALIYVVKHVGTSGSGGYLKVKIKCTGFDNNGDGNPDASLYIRE